jgi:hypothetical protein
MNWINVKDELPENNQEVLVFCKQELDEWFVLLNYTKSEGFVFRYNGFEYEDNYTDVVIYWCIPTKPE